MRAIILREVGGPEMLRLESAPDPEPGPGEVVVRLRAAALNHRDAWIRRGLYAGITLPIILGSDGAGTVASAGPDVAGDWIGREVVVNPTLDWGPDHRAQGPQYRILGLPDDGTYADYVKVPASNVVPKPPSLGWHEAAAIPLAGLTAYRAIVSRARLQAGETVLVTGAGGGVSTFALLFAHHLGARVFVTSGSDAKLKRARHLGALGGVNYRDADWAKEIKTLSGGGFDVIIDSAGCDVLPALLDIARPGGRIVTYGATTGSPTTVEVRRIFWKQLSLLGTTMGTPAEFAAMVALIDEAGITPVVDEVFPLAETPAAHRRMDRAGQFGKIVLEMET